MCAPVCVSALVEHLEEQNTGNAGWEEQSTLGNVVWLCDDVTGDGLAGLPVLLISVSIKTSCSYQLNTCVCV